MMFSAAVLQGLHEMRRPREEIKHIAVTEAEFRATQQQIGMSRFDIDIAVRMMRGGAAVDGGNGLRVTLVDETPTV